MSSPGSGFHFRAPTTYVSVIPTAALHGVPATVEETHTSIGAPIISGKTSSLNPYVWSGETFLQTYSPLQELLSVSALINQASMEMEREVEVDWKRPLP